MLADSARPLARTLLFCAAAAALLVGLTSAAGALAQDTKHVVCTANKTGDGWDCGGGTPETTEPTAAPTPAATTVPPAVTAPAVAPAAAPAPAPAPVVAPAAPVTPEPTVAAAPAEYPLDWVPIDQVPAELRDLDCLLCRGRYMDPLAGEDKQANPDEANIDAFTTSTEMRGELARFYGGVQVSQGYRRFRGDEATINRETGAATLSGNVILREPGILLQGSHADLLFDTGEARLENSQFVLQSRHLQGSAGLLERDADGLIHVHDGSITYCPPGHEDWQVRAGSIRLDLEDGLGTARDATLDIAGVPVFYTPWLQFPLDDRRRTGLLWPDFGNDSTGGLDITAPVYFNLAPNYDALYSPRYIEDRGLNHELETRYLNKYLGLWEVGGAYLHQDDRYQDEVPPGTSDDRWLTAVRQNGLLDQRWRSRIDYTEVSDVDYMKDLETSSLTAQRRTSLLQIGIDGLPR